MATKITTIAGGLLLLHAMTGCDGNQDVTKDPKYNFSGMTKTTWKLKTPLALQTIRKGTMGYGDVCTEEYARQFATGTADRGKFGVLVVDILPSGELIRIEGLETGSAEMGGVVVPITILTGKYKDYVLEAPHKWFLPNKYLATGESTTWTVNPDNLEKP